MAWRVARSLDKLLAQINAYAPNRSKISDGSIGDTAHSSRVSDHNPDPRGIVHARDFTHSPTRGFDAHAFVRRLAKAGDRRIKYLISNRQISNPSIGAGRWRPYSGINPHTQHAHVSCVYGALEDNTANWPGIGATAGIATAPTPPAAPPKPKGVLGMTKRVQTDTNSKPQTIGAKPDHSYHLWIDEKQKNMSPVIGPAHFGLNAVIEITGCQPGERVVGQIQRAYYGDGPTRLGYAHGIDEGYANNNGTLILNIPANGYIAKKSGKASVRLRVTLKHNGGNPITVRRVRILGNTD